MKKHIVFVSLLTGIFLFRYSFTESTITDNEADYEWFNRPETTYEKFLPLAVKGDANIQNFLGYMYFYGEGVIQDYEQAYTWFLNAAEQGNIFAQKNLAIFHSGTIKGIPKKYYNTEEANKWLNRFEENIDELKKSERIKIITQSNNKTELTEWENAVLSGEKYFIKFCAGCHGFNGIAYYAGAPSFALGERLNKNNEELCKSITNGKNIMPSWGNKLSQKQILNIIAFIRTLPVSFQQGITGNLRNKPESYFRFRPLGETGSEWNGADPIGIPPFEE